jgi:hypothetical protein
MGRNTDAGAMRARAADHVGQHEERPSRPVESPELRERRRAELRHHVQDRLVALRYGMYDRDGRFMFARGAVAGLARQAGLTPNGMRDLVAYGSAPRVEHLPGIARALQVDPRTILYWMGVYSLEALAASVGIAPWYWYASEADYQADLDALASYTEPRYREVQRDRYDRWWQATRRQREALALTDAEWARFVDYANSEPGRDQLRADLYGADPADPDEEAGPGATTYLPAEYTGGGAATPVSAPPRPRPRRHTANPLIAADVESGERAEEANTLTGMGAETESDRQTR